MSHYIQEAFKKFDLLEEEDFNLDASGVDELANFLDKDDETDFESIIDPEAESEEDLEDSYVGKVILECSVCHSKIYKNADEINLDEETEIANEGEECPFCYSVDGYTIVGQVAPYQDAEVKVDVEPKDDEVEAEEVSESCGDKKKRKIKEDLDFNDGSDFTSKVYKALADVIFEFSDKGLTKKDIDKALEFFDVHFYEDEDIEIEECMKEESWEAPVDESVNESEGQDISEYQKWVDYDMEKYRKISDDTMKKIKKAGLSVVKDQYGEYEVIADRKDESLSESIENLDVETEHDKIHIETEEKEESGEEVIAPIGPAEEDTILGNNEEVKIEEPVEQEVDVDFDNFDEESFDQMGESYLKKVYENVNSFKTSSVKMSGNKLMIEGVISFNSGKNKKTTFMFEAKDANKDGKLRLIGENLQFSQGKKSFQLKGFISDNKFISESLNYNYRVNGNRVYGTIKNSLSEAKDLSKVEGSMTKILTDNKEAINKATSKEELISTVKSLVKDINTPASKRLIMNLAKQRSLEGALQTVYNSMLAGSNLAVDRK